VLSGDGFAIRVWGRIFLGAGRRPAGGAGMRRGGSEDKQRGDVGWVRICGSCLVTRSLDEFINIVSAQDRL